MLLFVVVSSCDSFCGVAFDCSCIEADDFGEFQQQVLTIKANGGDDRCEYDSSLPLTDDNQGSGLTDCLTLLPTAVDGGDGEVYDSTEGCLGFTDDNGGIVIEQKCISQCIIDCDVGRLSQSSEAEPFWDSTTSTFLIGAGHEVEISATGSVTLAEDISIGPFYAKPDNFYFHSIDESSNEQIIDVKAGGDMILSFNGQWEDGPDSGNFPNADDVYLGPGELNYLSLVDSNSYSKIDQQGDIYNGVRRLVAYVDPHPAGYYYDSSYNNEKLATQGVPFSPDEELWRCDYDSTDVTLLESDCYSLNYRTSGYDNIDENTDLSVYDISSAIGKSSLGEIGGMIRWTDDGLASFDEDSDNPFDSGGEMIVCNKSGNCANSDGADYVSGMIGQSLDGTTEDNAYTYTNNEEYPVSVSFINLGDDDSCNLNDAMSVKHFDEDNNEIYPDRDDRIDIDDEWSKGDSFFYLESGDKLKMWDVNVNMFPGLVIHNGNGDVVTDVESYIQNIDPAIATYGNRIIDLPSSSGPYTIESGNDSGYFRVASSSGSYNRIKLENEGVTFFNNNPDITFEDAILGTNNSGYNKNCAEFYAYRVDKVHEIEIKKSGMLTFTMLGNGASGDSCNLKTRIVNPNGDRIEFSDGDGGTLEADFYEYGDADEGIDHPTESIVVDVSNTSSNSFNWTESQQIFVRKGQMLRFSPRSWDGVWQDGSSGNRKCGIGMAMKIEPRLALLCRGQKSESVTDITCKLNEAGDACLDWDPRCDDSTDSNYYCPLNETFPYATDVDGDGNLDKNCQDPDNFIFGSAFDTYYSIRDSEGNNLCDMYAGKDLAAGESAYAQCRNCADVASLVNADPSNPTVTPEVSLTLDQCYDLEAYEGKVSNINQDTGFTDNQLEDSTVAKGARVLGTFNGYYGNMESFLTDGTDSNGNMSYRLYSTVAMSYAGRLKFVVLDGADFNISVNNPSSDSEITGYDSYDGNHAVGGSPPFSSNFDGDDGYSITLRGSEEYFNGEMMEVKLCKDTVNDDGDYGQDCIGSTVEQMTDQPRVVDIDDSTIGGEIGYLSYYQFNEFGKLVRIANDNAGGAVPTAVEDDPNTEENESLSGNFTSVGTEFYLHNHSENEDRIRLSFKILDTDVYDCDMDNASLNQDCSGGNCDGIVRKNNFYILDSANTGEICSVGEGAIGSDPDTECQDEYYCADKYSNNSGSYKVVVRTKNPDGSAISTVVDNVIAPVVEVMDGTEEGVEPAKIGQAERVYTLIINDPTFKTIVKMVFILAVTFYGIGYLMGVSQFSQTEVISRVVRISIIFLFISPDGWYWFDKIFVQFFKEGTDYLAFLMATSFDTSPELEQALANNDFYDKSILFASIDDVFGIFFSDAAQKKIASLLFASIFGWAYLYIIYMAFLLYVYAVANAVLLYLTSQVFISILFIIGPIFFVFLFFNQTKEMFDKWLSQLIGFSLQQIFLLTTLAFFNMMMYEILKLALGYRICWDDILVINTPIRISLLSFYTIATLPPRLSTQNPVGNIGVNSGIPSIFSILFIWVIASLMKQFISFMTDLAATIGGGIKASSLGSGVASAAGKLGQGVKGLAGKAWKESGMAERVQRMDQSLFDSGKLADAARDKRKAQNKKDRTNKNAMGKSAKKAVSEYKRNNMEKLAAMSKAEQKRTLDKVAQDAGVRKGKALGLSEEESKRVMDDKSFKTESDSLTGAAFDFAKHKYRGGGKSVKDGVKSKVTRKDIKKAMQNTDAKGRNKILSGVKKGNIDVQAKKTTRLKNNIGRITAAALTGGLSEVGVRSFKAGKAANENRKAWNKAEAQLVKSGAINKMRKGFGAFRSKGDNDQIKAQMAKNKEESSVGVSANRNAEIAHAMQQHVIATELQEGQGGEFTRKEGSFSAAVLGRRKGYKTAYKQNRAEAKNAAALKVKGARNEAIEGLEARKAAAHNKFEAAINKRDDVMKQIEGDGEDNVGLKNAPKLAEMRSLENDFSKEDTPKLERMQRLQSSLKGQQAKKNKTKLEKDSIKSTKKAISNLKNDKGYKKERADRDEQISNLRQDKGYQQQKSALDEANRTAHGHQNTADNYEQREKSLDTMIDQVKGGGNTAAKLDEARENFESAQSAPKVAQMKDLQTKFPKGSKLAEMRKLEKQYKKAPLNLKAGAAEKISSLKNDEGYKQERAARDKQISNLRQDKGYQKQAENLDVAQTTVKKLEKQMKGFDKLEDGDGAAQVAALTPDYKQPEPELSEAPPHTQGASAPLAPSAPENDPVVDSKEPDAVKEPDEKEPDEDIDITNDEAARIEQEQEYLDDFDGDDRD